MPGWQPLLEQLRGSSDRMARLIGQLLSLARSKTTDLPCRAQYTR